MRFGNMGYAEVILFCNVEVGINIPFGIDNNCFSCCLAAHQITSLGKAFIVNVFEKHIRYCFIIEAQISDFYLSLNPTFVTYYRCRNNPDNEKDSDLPDIPHAYPIFRIAVLFLLQHDPKGV